MERGEDGCGIENIWKINYLTILVELGGGECGDGVEMTDDGYFLVLFLVFCQELLYSPSSHAQL